ncbi:LptA/OstA family protein [Glacieibacterium sp.]|uniref:LptA/OstA family protein n=1 Tax=Glacieibacterium sp. TaxID=2860237 RepID=UPI003AFFD1A2
MKIALILLPLLLATAAAAQNSALKGHNTDAPIDVDAARIEVSDKANQAIFSGDVHIRQTDLKLDADSVKVFYLRPKTGDPTIQRLDATGNVVMTSPTEKASGRLGIYDVTQRQITLIGDVVLNRGDSVLRGQRLAIDLDSGRSTLDGANAPGKPGEPATGGRVSGRFVVPPRNGSN